MNENGILLLLYYFYYVTQAPVSVPVTQAPVSVLVTQASVPVPVTQASVSVSSQQKLHLLYQHLEGRAKKVVEQLQFLIGDPERVYTEARKRLKERFGHPAILSAEFEFKLTNWPKVGNSDARGMQEFSDFLQQVEIASEYIPNLKSFEFSSKLQSLVDKLLGWFKTKWSIKVQRLQQSWVIMRFHPFRNL